MDIDPIADRIRQLLKELSLTTVDFAQKIETRPSAITHLINGRNKPSFSVIQKILLAFPFLSPDWFVLGKGTIWREEKAEPDPHNATTETRTNNPQNESYEHPAQSSSTSIVTENLPESPHTSPLSEENTAPSQEEKPIITLSHLEAVENETTDKNQNPPPLAVTTPSNAAITPQITTNSEPPELIVLHPDGHYSYYAIKKDTKPQ